MRAAIDGVIMATYGRLVTFIEFVTAVDRRRWAPWLCLGWLGVALPMGMNLWDMLVWFACVTTSAGWWVTTRRALAPSGDVVPVEVALVVARRPFYGVALTLLGALSLVPGAHGHLAVASAMVVTSQAAVGARPPRRHLPARLRSLTLNVRSRVQVAVAPSSGG